MMADSGSNIFVPSTTTSNGVEPSGEYIFLSIFFFFVVGFDHNLFVAPSTTSSEATEVLAPGLSKMADVVSK